MSDTPQKLVDGVLVDCTPEDIAQMEADRKAAAEREEAEAENPPATPR